MLMQGHKRYATIQVDLDGLWAIEQLLGKDVPIDPDPVVTVGVERLLSIFEKCGVKATFFVVARDLGASRKVELLKEIVARGHEIASHGFNHKYLSSLNKEHIKKEIAGSKEALEKTLGITIAGFKAPGFAASKEMAAALEDAGYLYDSSVFATSCGFLMELVSKIPYMKTEMFFAPSAPYTPSRRNIFRHGNSGIIEIPVTAMPFIRTPAHFSYAVIGGRVYASMVRASLRLASPKVVNYLFHPLDLVDGTIVTMSGKVYGLCIKADRKIEMAREMLAFLCKGRTVVTTMELCNSIKINYRGIGEAS